MGTKWHWRKRVARNFIYSILSLRYVCIFRCWTLEHGDPEQLTTQNRQFRCKWRLFEVFIVGSGVQKLPSWSYQKKGFPSLRKVETWQEYQTISVLDNETPRNRRYHRSRSVSIQLSRLSTPSRFFLWFRDISSVSHSQSYAWTSNMYRVILKWGFLK